MSSKKSPNNDKVDADDDELRLIDDAEDIEEPGDQSEEPNPDSDITLLLKELAEHPEEPYEQIAQEMEIPPARARTAINDFVQHLIGTHTEPDFPERMRAHYNSLVKKDSNKLTGKDMMTLMSLINKFHAKLLQKVSTIRERDKLTNKMADMKVEGVQPVRKTVPKVTTSTNTNTPEAQVVYTDSYGNQPSQQGERLPQQQGQQDQPPQEGWAPYDNEESLMKFLLENNVSIRDPNKIRSFMQMYRWMKNEFTTTPQKLLVLLKSSFAPSAAEAVYLAYMDMKSQVSDDPQNLYKLTGASNYRPVNPNLEQLLAGSNPALRMMIQENLRGGQPQYGPAQEDPQEAKFNRELDRMQKMITMSLMQNMANKSMGGQGQSNGMGGVMGEMGQYGVNPNDYDIYEDLDNEGRIRGRRMIRKAGFGYGYQQFPGQQNNGNDKATEIMMQFIKMTTEASNADRQLLMQKLLTNDQGGLNDVVGTILKQAVGVIGAQSDPLQSLNKTMELADKMNQIRRPDQPKSMEEKKMELEFILARKDMERSDVKEAREYERQRDESRSADDRIGHIIDGLAGAAKDVLTPAVSAITQSFGSGLAGRVPGMPPGAMPPGVVPGQQVPPQKVIIKEVLQPNQQPAQVSPAYVQPGPTEQDIAYAQQQEEIRRERELAQMEAQQDNRPLEQQLGDFADDEIDGLALKMEGELIHNERAFHKVLAERNKRRLRSGGAVVTQPERKFVSPIAKDIAQHEQQQREMMMAQNQPQPEIKLFDDDSPDPYPGPNPNVPEPNEEAVIGVNSQGEIAPEPNVATPSAPDLSDAYEDEDIKESLRLAGQLQDTDDNSRFGVPGTASVVPQGPSIQEPEAEEETTEGEVTYNPEDIDMSNDTEVE